MNATNKFNIGDKVYFIPLQAPCIIKDIKVYGLILVEPIYEVQVLTTGSVELATESELDTFLPSFKPIESLAQDSQVGYYDSICECGAKFTLNKNAHSTWCRAYRSY